MKNEDYLFLKILCRLMYEREPSFITLTLCTRTPWVPGWPEDVPSVLANCITALKIFAHDEPTASRNRRQSIWHQ